MRKKQMINYEELSKEVSYALRHAPWEYELEMYNFDNDSEDLKDTFRHDLHQVLAYSAFNSMKNKKVVLAYPFSDFALHNMQISDNISSSTIDVYLVGIPIERNKIDLTEMGIETLMMF